jgi:hypothetical protein
MPDRSTVTREISNRSTDAHITGETDAVRPPLNRLCVGQHLREGGSEVEGGREEGRKGGRERECVCLVCVCVYS